MAALNLNKLCCHNPACDEYGKFANGNIKTHGYYRCKTGKMRRLKCGACRKTFSTTKGTVYYRLQKSKCEFDNVVQTSVEGVSQSSNARINRLSRGTVFRWLIVAAEKAKLYSNRNLKKYNINEVQADEIRIFIQSKSNEQWVFAAMEVTSRIWPSFVLGKRSYQNTLNLFLDFQSRALLSGSRFLLSTDGFGFYKSVVFKTFGYLPIYAQVIKTIRKNRVCKVEQKLIYGTEFQLDEALANSDHSSKINTSYIERLNLTIRQSLSHLQRKTIAHSRYKKCLEEQLQI